MMEYHKNILFFCFVLVTQNTGLHSITVPNLPTTSYQDMRDVNIGVILPVHHHSLTDFCSQDVADLGTLQRIEAIPKVITEINNRTDILPDLKLGFVMFDDCDKDVNALAQSLHFIQDEETATCRRNDQNTTCSNSTLGTYDVIGILGSESSTTTIQSANLLTSFQIPLISYSASAASLNDRNKYRDFQRTVPPDTVQASVIMQFLKKFGWSYVSVVYTQGQFGEQAFEALDDEATTYDICFAKVFEIKHSWTKSQYQQMVYELAQEIYARIVVVLTPLTEARLILEASETMALDGRMTWIASTGWLRSTKELFGIEHNALGSFSINYLSNNVRRFDDYFQTITPISQNVNPWMSEFWEKYHNCTLDDSRTKEYEICQDDKIFAEIPEYSPEVTIAQVYDAVYSYAYALHEASESPDCRWDILTCLKQVIRKSLAEVSFEGETIPIKYTDEGYVERDFVICNVQTGAEGYTLVEIGKWSKDTNELTITNRDIQWAPYYGTKPDSYCSAPCDVGREQVLQQKRCCWSCEPCEDNQKTYVKNGITRCTTCENGTWPDRETRTRCEALIPGWLNWSDLMGVVLLTISAVGLFVTGFASVLYTINISNPLIKASSRELTYMLFVGIVSCYSFTVAFVLEPTSQVCYGRFLGVSLNFTLLYAPLMTKTIRIYRIFEAGQRMVRKPILVSAKSQGAIVFAIVSIHAGMIVTWSYFDAPRAQLIQPQPHLLDAICVFPFEGYIASLSYNLILLVISVFFAFKTRKLPDNYSESKFIGLCVYSTIVIWITFIPAYFTVNDALLKVIFLGLDGIANATLMLVFIIMPKLYALYFVDKTDLHVSPRFKVRKGTIRLAEETSHDNSTSVSVPDRNVSQLKHRGAAIGEIESQLHEESTNNSLENIDIHSDPPKESEDKQITKTVQRKISEVSMTQINPSYAASDITKCDEQHEPDENYEMKGTKYIEVEPAPYIFVSDNIPEFV